MTVEQSPYSADMVYRPTLEANSILLETAVGCAWSKCTFCYEQSQHRFREFSPEDIRGKLSLLSELPDSSKKDNLFLLGENPLVFSTDRLLEIFAAVNEYLPKVAKINMYGRCRDVLNKGERDLYLLKEKGLGVIYVGVESGSDAILEYCDKGCNVEDMMNCFALLDRLDISYSLSSIIGLGGKEQSDENAVRTAELYNHIHPESIRVNTLYPKPGTGIYDDIQAGRFTRLTPGESVLEERLFLEHLNINNCIFLGTHVSNIVSIAGYFAEDKEEILEYLDDFIESEDLESLVYPVIEHM